MILKFRIENWHVGSFGKLRRARQVLQQFVVVPLISPLISQFGLVCSITFDVMPRDSPKGLLDRLFYAPNH